MGALCFGDGIIFFSSDAVFLEDSGVRERGKVEFKIQRMTNKCIFDLLLPLRLPVSLFPHPQQYIRSRELEGAIY